MLLLALAPMVAACTPTVRVEAPKDPIVINLNVKIEQEVRIKVEKDVERSSPGQPEPLLGAAAMVPLLRTVAIVLLSLGFLAAPALAASLDQAKAAGQVGERIDGFLGVVDANAPADVRAMVDQINAERQAKYKQIADKQGAPVAAVAQIAGKKLLERTPKGEYILGADGQWRKK